MQLIALLRLLHTIPLLVCFGRNFCTFPMSHQRPPQQPVTSSRVRCFGTVPYPWFGCSPLQVPTWWSPKAAWIQETPYKRRPDLRVCNLMQSQLGLTPVPVKIAQRHDLCVFAIINPLEFFYECLAEVTDVCCRTTETDPTKPKKGFKNGKHIEPVKSPITLQLLYEMY